MTNDIYSVCEIKSATEYKMVKRKKAKVVKPVTENASEPRSAIDTLQYNLPKGVKDDRKVRPKDVFEGFVDPKKTKKTKKT